MLEKMAGVDSVYREADSNNVLAYISNTNKNNNQLSHVYNWQVILIDDILY